MRNYMKKKQKKIDVADLTADELISRTVRKGGKFPKYVLGGVLLLCIGLSATGIALTLNTGETGLEEIASGGNLPLALAPAASASAKKDLISIPAGTVKANPFLPYREIGNSAVSDVPKFDLIEPPEVVNESSDAARVMDTIVSGILYDKYSPSAILNIEGNDYLVKKGDVVNNYKVVNIMQDSVTVKLGNNVYKAGIGEILTEGAVNYNDVSNLSKKFGGKK